MTHIVGVLAVLRKTVSKSGSDTSYLDSIINRLCYSADPAASLGSGSCYMGLCIDYFGKFN